MAKTTGKLTYKQYKCAICETEKSIQTNHWGECYPYCFKCQQQTEWRCMESPPPGVIKPPKWKQVKLGDIVDIIPGGKK